MGFCKDFVWGGASAAYQIEGAAYEDNKGPSVWDMFCKQDERINDGTSGDIACNHYHRYQQDIDLMKEIGYQAYRFSISWPRVIPEGIGAVNNKGIDFYDRLVDKLLEAGIKPFVTLFHWDYPYILFQKGGWTNPDSPKWFSDYATTVAEHLGDRVKHFITINEPQCFIGLAYNEVRHAPGIRLPEWDRLLMMHNVLLGHGMAVQAIRSAFPDAQIGWAPTCKTHYPVTEDPLDVEAARKAIFAVEDDWCWSASAWSDPVLFGKYPEELLTQFGHYMPHIKPNDMKIISTPIDFYGQNIYNGRPVSDDGMGGYQYCERKAGFEMTAAKWPITPPVLYWGPKFMYERYEKPIYVTENGLSCSDVVSLDGKVHDSARIDFLHRYLHEYRRAAEDGVDVRGYFHWSVTDNFEWDKGFTERFGMVYCDFETQQRILKDSAYWYSETIRANGSNL